MSGQIRVLIVDDDALVRTGLTMLLAGVDDIEVVGEAANGSEVEVAMYFGQTHVRVEARNTVTNSPQTADIEWRSTW